ncbi:unnamed protein product [Meloidogyne enterolobii]|uniref:Uncharacterized protein n=1 Tax=Meloidogyne enterolobii TaxID=390850 RepID=A0ACB0XZD9_MELEN
MSLLFRCFKSLALRNFCTVPPVMSFPTPRIGLELGLTDCRVAVFNDRKAEVIKDGSKTKTIPSVVAFAKGDDIIIGDAAIRHKNSKNIFFMMELLIGKKFDDPIVQIIR